MNKPLSGLPLAGKTYVLTRALHQVKRLAQQLSTYGAQVLVFPTLDIRYLPLSAVSQALVEDALIDSRLPQWWVFNSANGVDALWQQLNTAQQAALRDPRRTLSIACVGPQTASRLAHYGVSTQWIPAIHHAEALAEGLKERVKPGETVQIWQAKEGRQTLQQVLQTAGCVVSTHRIYQTVKPTDCQASALEQLLQDCIPSGVIFTSPSSVRHFADCLTPSLKQQLRSTQYHSIGPITSEAVRAYLGPVTCEANPHTLDALVTHLCAYEPQHQV